MRLFIALPLTKEAREFIEENSKHIIPALTNGARLVSPENWHFTLAFLGNQPDYTYPLEEAIGKTAEKFEKPEIRIEKIDYSPGRSPRMAWAYPDKKSNEKMAEIQKELVENLKKENIEWREENRPYSGHINLVRFEPTSIDNLPKIRKETDFSYKPSSIELVKSTLKRSGAEYETIFESPFKS